jgi:ParB family transcriptional regulator, chromosome partitioning protein
MGRAAAGGLDPPGAEGHADGTGQVAEVVQAVQAKRPAPTPRPDPVTLDLGDGLTVTVRWRKPSDVSTTQALRKALKAAQEQEAKGRAGQGAA